MKIRVYSRNVINHDYPEGLANSIHMSLIEDGMETNLNQNYGMIFVNGEITPANTISPRGLINPSIFADGDKYVILADYVDENKTNMAESMLYRVETKDFLSFDHIGLVEGDSLFEFENKAKESGQQTLSETTGRFDMVEIPMALVKDIKDRWMPLEACRVSLTDMPKDGTISDVKAIVEYTDGSTDIKAIDWDEKEGSDEISGQIRMPEYKYPIMKGFADPQIFIHKGIWYCLSTNDNNDDVGLYLRSANSPQDLFIEGRYKISVILDYNEEKDYIQTFWAPEFHHIGDDDYILFALGGKKWAPQCHMMKLKKGEDPMDEASWEEPVRVRNVDGEHLTTVGITLDMTHFEAKGQDYLVWSERYNIGTSLDSGSMIYIATTDAQNPYQITSKPVLLTRPLLGWENVAGTINNEGPYVLKHGGKIYIAYSGGSANDTTYAVGYMIADEEDDLLDLNSWIKQNTPALWAYSAENIDGPGHNSFFEDEDGHTMIAYHGQLEIRCSAVHRVHFDKNDYPYLNMGNERDLPLEMRKVTMKVK